MLIVGGLAVPSVLGRLHSVPLAGPANELRGCWVTIIGYGRRGVRRTFLHRSPSIPRTVDDRDLAGDR